jgi:hypothetical protein
MFIYMCILINSLCVSVVLCYISFLHLLRPLSFMLQLTDQKKTYVYFNNIILISQILELLFHNILYYEQYWLEGEFRSF